MSKNETLSSDDNDFYKKVLSLLNNEFKETKLTSEDALLKLRSIFNDLNTIDSKESQIFLNELKNQNPSLDFIKILNHGTHEQMMHFFKEIAKLGGLTKKEISQIQPLYHFITGALIYSKKNDSEKITLDELMEYLNLEVLIRTASVREDFPKDLISKLLKYLKQIPDIDFSATQQSDDVYSEHFIFINKLKQLIFFPDSNELQKNDNIMEIINTIMKKPITTDGTAIQNYVSQILFDGAADEEDLNNINIIVSDFIETEEYVANNRVFYGILNSIINQDLDNLIKYTDEYIRIYLNLAKHKDTPELTLEDKIILFFSDYFADFQTFTNLSYKKFINIFIDFYQKDFFWAFMNHYKIPFNLGVREEKKFFTENSQELVTQSYYCLFECALFSDNFIMVEDLLEIDNILEPINIRVVEDDKVYEYVTEPLNDLYHTDENHLFFLIEMGLINENFTFRALDDEKDDEIILDPFTFFLKNGLDQCFIKLCQLNREQNPDFSLKKYLPELGLLSYYFISLKEYEADAVNGEILNVFREEGYKLFEENTEGFTPVDYLKDLDVGLVTHVVAMMQDMFEAEKPLSELIGETTTIDNLITQNSKTELIPWFNRPDLEAHYKKMSKVKESERQSSLEYIKTMLSDNNHLRKNLMIEDETFFDALKAKFPNFHEVINFYKGQFRLKNLTSKIRIQPILLLGEAGVGKTYFAKELAHTLNTGYTFIDMGSLTSNWVLSGNNGSWKNAKQGKILESLVKGKTINPLMLMDEIDKARGGDYDPTMVLYQLLEEVNAKEFTDEYVDFPFDASGIIYIACANSIQSIPEPLLSRFKVFTIVKPEDEQHTTVINNIYQEAIKNAKIFSPDLSSDVIKKLKGFSLRAAKVALDDAISRALLQITPEQIQEKIREGDKISITVEHLKDPAKKKTFGFDEK